MKTFPGSFTDVLGGATKTPRYVARFFHVECRTEWPFSADFTTGPVAGETSSYFQLLDFPTGNTQTVEPEQGRSSIGTFRLPFLDQDGIVTRYISSPRVTLAEPASRGAETIAASVSAGDIRDGFPEFGTIELFSAPVARLTETMTPGITALATIGKNIWRPMSNNAMTLVTGILSATAWNMAEIFVTGIPKGTPPVGYIAISSESFFYFNPYVDGVPSRGDPPDRFGDAAWYGFVLRCSTTQIGWGPPDMVDKTSWIQTHTPGDTVRFYTPNSYTFIQANVVGNDLRTVFSGSGWIRVGSEYIQYSTLTASTFGTFSANPVSRGYWASEAASHAAGVPIEQIPSIVLKATMAGSVGNLTDYFSGSGFVLIDHEQFHYPTLTASTFGNSLSPCQRMAGGTATASHTDKLWAVQTRVSMVVSGCTPASTILYLAGDLHVGSGVPLNLAFHGGTPVHIGDEIILPVAVTGSSFGSAPSPALRGQLGTTAASHGPNMLAYQLWWAEVASGFSATDPALYLQQSNYLTYANAKMVDSGELRVDQEVVRYSSVASASAGDALTTVSMWVQPVTRGACGTVATSHAQWTTVVQTKAWTINSAITHTDGTGPLETIKVFTSVIPEEGITSWVSSEWIRTFASLQNNSCDMIRIDSEALYPDYAPTGSNFQLSRGALGTTVTSHAIGARVYAMVWVDVSSHVTPDQIVIPTQPKSGPSLLNRNVGDFFSLARPIQVGLELMSIAYRSGSAFGRMHRGYAGTDASAHVQGASISAQYRERVRYATLTASTFGSPTYPVSRGVDGTFPVFAFAATSLQNGEQIRPGQRVQLFVGDDSLPFAQYASFGKMDVAQRMERSPGTYEIVTQDVQRSFKRYAFIGASPDVTGANSASHVQTLQGNPFDLLLRVWTTTSYDLVGGASLPNGPYDAGDGNGLGIATHLIAVESIEAIRDRDFPDDVYTFFIREPVEVKPWTEAMLKTLNCYPVVTQSGALSVRRATASGTVVASLTADTIIGVPQWQAGDAMIYNQYTFLYDFGEPGREGEYSTRETFVAEESVRRHGRRTPFVVEAQGVRTEEGGAEIALDRAQRFFERYADPPPTLSAELLYSQIRLEAGDVVTVSHSWTPNLRTGTRGISGEQFEVTDMRPIFAPEGGAPRVQAKLLWLGYAPQQQTVSVTSAAGPQITYAAK